MSRIVDMTKCVIACRFLTVDANVDAVQFYIKNGFNYVDSCHDTRQKTVPLYFDFADYDDID